jgi:glutamate-5-semialdehyde dehydrogenase
MDVKTAIRELATRARAAANDMATASAAAKNAALQAMADGIEQQAPDLKKANARDLAAGRDAGLSDALLDRLELTDKRIATMADGLRQMALLPDPVGAIISGTVRPNGLRIQRMRVPIGVIVIIYESRPNVTADAAGLCIKAGNAVVLRGGKEAIHSNRAIWKLLQEGLAAAGLPPDAIGLVETTDRQAIDVLITADDLVDLVIPRGGEGLIRRVSQGATVPVIKHYNGICHTYVDEAADLQMASEICFNAKCQRTGVCNAMETLLVHRAIAPRFLPGMIERYQDAGVEIRGCEATRQIVPDIEPATETDWRTEYLDLVLSIRVVDSLDDAAAHIREYGSAHTDAIVTNDIRTANRFVQSVDSSSVMINASTRFSDGYEYGMGAEIGISTDKLHARGPMGLEELTTYKFVVYGDGQLRQ